MDRGYFISFEGGDGSGKSTQIRRLKNYLEQQGYDVLLTREPGGTDIGEDIRKIILDPANDKITDLTEALLYAASRAQHIAQIIKPALESGKTVICDRFVDSSIAYQGYARGLGECVSVINQYAIDKFIPDLTFLMKVTPDVGTDRIKNRKKDRIEMESENFHQAVYDGYEKLEKMFPNRIVGIDASGSVESIHKDIIYHIENLIKSNNESN